MDRSKIGQIALAGLIGYGVYSLLSFVTNFTFIAFVVWAILCLVAWASSGDAMMALHGFLALPVLIGIIVVLANLELFATLVLIAAGAMAILGLLLKLLDSLWPLAPAVWVWMVNNRVPWMIAGGAIGCIITYYQDRYKKTRVKSLVRL